VRARQVAVAAVALLVYVTLLVGGVLLLYFGKRGADFCPYCHDVSCVPLPWWTCPGDVDLCAGM